MFGGLLKPKFYKKCKSIISVSKIRVDIVRKKKNVVCKFLKTDVVDLLKNGHDYNAYTRTAGLLEEKKRLSCYDLIEQFYDCILANLSLMLKQRECPKECREAVSSLIYAAARVPEIPELKDLRAVFTERYGNSLEPSVNRELVDKLESRYPSRETKIQTMQDIAQEFSISWDSKALQQMLLRQPSTLQIKQKDQPPSQIDDCRDQTPTGMKNGPENGSDGHDDPRIWKQRRKNSSEDMKRKDAEKGKELKPQRGREGYTDDKKKINSYSGSEDESIWSSRRRESTDHGSFWGSSSGSVSEDETDVTKKKPLSYRFIPPPYTKPGVKMDENAQVKNTDQEKPTPRSVWQKFLGRQGTDNVASMSNREASSTEKGFRDIGLKIDPKLSSRPTVPELEVTKQNEDGTRTNKPSFSFQHPKLPDYDRVAAQVAALRRRKER